MKERRTQLMKDSNKMQQLVKEGKFETVNAALVAMYAEQGHTDLNTFNQWQSKGYTIKKGSKALLLWASPKNLQNASKSEQATELNKMLYYPVACMFSAQMVEKKK